MKNYPIAVLGSGMMTGVGLTTAASCAAIRSAVDNFQETRFHRDGDWLLGCQVAFDQPWRGKAKLVKMIVGALDECLGLVPEASSEDIPLLLNVAEESRPGRAVSVSSSLYDDLVQDLGASFHPESRVLAQGRVGGAVALNMARRLLYRSDDPHRYVILAGVDSLLVGRTLASFGQSHRLLTAKNSDGFIPGEAGAALLLSRPEQARDGALVCCGLGFAREDAAIESERPLRAEGLTKAIKAALAEAGLDLANMDYRLTDMSGEQYGFKEAVLALSRVLRTRKEEFDIWHPADCIGEVGAAALPCMLGVAISAFRKGYAPGPNVLCHLSNDDGKRAALVLRAVGGVH